MNLRVFQTSLAYKPAELFFALWALCLPITSVVLFPAIQGTTPAYLLAFSSLPFAILLMQHKAGRTLRYLLFTIGMFLVLNSISQLSLQLAPELDLSSLRLVNDYNGQLLLRSSLFTQSIYLFAGLCTFAFIATFYKNSWDKYLFWGISFLALYGLYEFFYFLLMGQNGDFLSNRIFDTGSSSSQGSLFQTFSFSGIRIMRLKSLTGEPSMYAFTVLPFWIHALHRRKTLVHVLLLITLILTTSTTAILGVAMYLLIRLWYIKPLRSLAKGVLDKYLLFIFLLGVVGTVFIGPLIVGFIDEMIVDKLTLVNSSGASRFQYFTDSLRFFTDAPVLNQFFGIGFGYIRSTDFFSTLLVNMGLVGFGLFTALFAYPIFKLRKTYFSFGIKAILVIIYITLMIAVPEFAYLSIWLYLGIAYKLLRTQ